MKRKHIVFLFFLVSLLATSCSKMENIFVNGKPVTEHRDVEAFRCISIFNNVNVKLVQSSHPYLELTCPENLIGKITTEIDGDTLVIKNKNEYNWLRSYDYSIDLTVYYDSLRQINYASIGDLTSADSIRGTGELSIDSTEFGIDTTMVKTFNLQINEGCGKINLPISCGVVKCIFGNGTSEVTLRGVSAYTEIIMSSYGVVHAESLCSTFVRVQSNSTNDAYVWAKVGLRAWIYSIGNVYYKGNPWVLEQCEGSGQVIKLD